MNHNIKIFLSIYLIKLNYFKSIPFLRLFPLLILINILSCESSKNFNIFSSQDIPSKQKKEEKVLEQKKKESSYKNDSNKDVDRKKKTKKRDD